MILMNLADIVERLDREFKELEPEVVGLRLTPSECSPGDLDECERMLRSKLPEGFRWAVEEFDLGNLSLGKVHFTIGGQYLTKVVDWNSKTEFPWWGGSGNRGHMILVAMLEGISVLLDATTGEVYALPHGESPERAVLVASEFRTFLRGAATAFIRNIDGSGGEEIGLQLAQDVGSSTEGSRFWCLLLT